MNRQEIKEQEEAAGRWAAYLDEVHAHIAGRFARSEQRQRARAYVQGLLSPIERKNGWQLAEAAGEANPYGYQELLSRALWDPDEVRDDVLDLVREKLADPAAVVVIDETGFVKKGTKSVGVAPQYSGTAGKIGNCQIGVFLAYAAQKGQVLMDREIYLPQVWTDDRERCQEAGVPETVEFATKLVLARRMLERVLEHGLPFAWVTADSVYGADYHLRRFLTEHHIPYVLAVAPNNQVRLGWEDGFESIRVDEVPAGWQAWILVRRSISDPSEIVYYRVCAPKETTLQLIVQVAGQRWKVEEAIERGKSECGLDQYEVRSWTGWYRHVTLSLVAQLCATLMAEQANAEPGKKAREPNCGSSSLQQFKHRRGLVVC